MIIRVEEPTTCEYIITVHSRSLCKHPAFKIEEKSKKFNLVCSPALKQKAFNKYQQKKREEKENNEKLKKKILEEEKGDISNIVCILRRGISRVSQTTAMKC